MSIDVILEELEKIHEKLDRLLVSGGEKEGMSGVSTPSASEIGNAGERRHPTDSKPLEVKTTMKEEVDMDFNQITVMNKTDKALLVVKKGKQQWLARQFIKDPLIEYFAGCVYNIVLKEKSDAGKPIGWITKKWEDFEVFKG